MLIFLPHLLLFAVGQSQQLTPLESFLVLHFGLFLAFSAVGLVINVMAFRDLSWMCHLPTNRLQIPSNSTDPGLSPARDDSATHPLILPITSFSLLSAFLSYNTTNVGSLSKLYSACTGLAGIWGLWVVSVLYLLDHLSQLFTRFMMANQIAFAGPKLVSRKTGADKHTSAFIFGNKSSASEQKKEWKREQKGKGR